MPKLFSHLKRGGRGVIAAALVAMALASGVVASATAASASTQGQWQPLSLQNGRQSQQSRWDTGDPAYYVSDGVVHLPGSLYRPTCCHFHG